MPVTMQYFAEQNLLVETAVGEISRAEFNAAHQSIKDMAISSGFLALADYTEAVVDFPFDEMFAAREISNSIAKSFGGARLAICVKDDLAKGMANMFSAIDEGHDFMVRVFESKKDALKWLGIGDFTPPHLSKRN